MGIFWLAGGLLLVFIVLWRRSGGVKGSGASDRSDVGSGFSFTGSSDAYAANDARDDSGPDDRCDSGSSDSASSDSGGSCDGGGGGGGD